MANGYGAGLGSTAAGKRKLNRVGTFKDIAQNKPTSPASRATAGPSMAQGPQQPGGFGPGPGIRKNIDPALAKGLPGGATGAATGTGYTAPVTAPARTPYSEARVGATPGAFGAPAGGFSQRSPWFGAFGEGGEGGGFGAPPTDPEAEAEPVTTEEGEASVTPFLSTLLPGADLQYGPRDLPTEPDLTTRGGYKPSLERAVDETGLTPEERGGVGGTAGETVGEINEDERQFNELIDQLDVSQVEAQRKLDAAFAQAQRRNAEVNAAMGTSVSGGYAGTTAASTLGYLQQMQDMMADFQTRKTNLQLQFLDKKMSRDFQRETQERQEAANLIQTMLASGQEIPQDLLDRAGDLAPAGAAGAAGAAGGEVPEGTTGEQGAMRSESGDLLSGPGGLGTSGTTRADPLSGEGEEHQWYARGSGGQYEYYRFDEDGNEVLFEAEPGGARFPGDSNLTARTTADTGAPGWEAGNHPTHGNDGVVKAAGSDFVAYRGAEVVPFLEYLDTRYAAENSSNQELTMEMGLFISHYKSQNDGDAPTWEEMEEHADRTGLLSKA
ncbi:hypothetical protein CMI37_30635 [Candidatus Pacearchaeota archaeon]|nr:hypothetical protein [Candidatus Pacearchaeota archaeon]